MRSRVNRRAGGTHGLAEHEHPRLRARSGAGVGLMRAIIGASVRFRLLVVAIAAGIMVVGVLQLRDAPVDVLPEFTPPYVEVQTEALGLSAEEVEQLVTVPLEADL